MFSSEFEGVSIIIPDGVDKEAQTAPEIASKIIETDLD
jgi:hypothetical protein